MVFGIATRRNLIMTMFILLSALFLFSASTAYAEEAFKQVTVHSSTYGPQINADITSPTMSNSVTVAPGNSVTVNYSYSVSVNTPVYVRLLQSNGSVLDSKEVTLTGGGTSGSTVLNVPTGTASGKYNVAIVVVSGGTVLDTRQEAVIVQSTVTANITSPTKSNPVTVAPGNSVTDKYSYSVTANTPVYVRLLQSNDSVLASNDVTLTSGGTSGSTVLTVLTGTSSGKYNVVIVTKSGGIVLHTQQEAVVVEPKVTVDITSPTKFKPTALAAGEKLTITVDNKADSQTALDIILQERNSDKRLRFSVTFEKATSTKSKTFTITVPSSTEAGKYDLLIQMPGSETVLDTEREAVTIDTKVTADITSPTKTNPVTVNGGDSLTVKFNYTANSDTGADIKILKTDGSVLASTSTSLTKSTSQKAKSASVSIPTNAASGKYNVSITSKYSVKVLDTETQAVIVGDTITVKVQSPTTAKPVSVKAGGKVDIEFRYSADTSCEVEVRLLKPDGKALVAKSLSLTRSSTTKTETVSLNLPAGTPAATYDLEFRSKTSDSRLALESKAVKVIAHPTTKRVQFLIGQKGCWVNGTFKSTDFDARVIHGRTMLPIRHVGEPLGWELGWDGNQQMATVIKNERIVRVWVNNNNAQVSTNGGKNWQTVRIDPDNTSVKPLLISGRVLLPLRFVSESMDTRVDWDSSTRTATVTQE
ncbi:MAG: copper amine oxidase N-terminal domain-containing protein [Candidatus Desulforudaceae bacterium]